MSYTNGLDDPSSVFQTVIYTGNATARAITFDGNSDMQPDWVWGKQRSGTDSHQVSDSVRGATKKLNPDTNAAEDTTSTHVTAFNSNGFSVGTGGGYNGNTITQVAWSWKAGTSFTNDASSTSIGSIDSAGSVNDTAGFSICTHTGTGSNATIKHGLSTAPKVIITKKTSASGGWQVGHESIGWQNGIYLEDTGASTGDAGAWNSTAPTSSIFYVGNSSFTNQSSATYVSYIFAEKKGYSKFGSYTGNGNADGTFVYTGFKPAFVMVKNTAISEQWSMHDNKRNDNVIPNYARLVADDSQAEATNTTFAKVELLSNGFKLGNSADVINDASVKFIYMAFAEQPFVTSTGVPTTAR